MSLLWNVYYKIVDIFNGIYHLINQTRQEEDTYYNPARRFITDFIFQQKRELHCFETLIIYKANGGEVTFG